jgi:hypothetical protein
VTLVSHAAAALTFLPGSATCTLSEGLSTIIESYGARTPSTIMESYGARTPSTIMESYGARTLSTIMESRGARTPSTITESRTPPSIDGVSMCQDKTHSELLLRCVPWPTSQLRARCMRAAVGLELSSIANGGGSNSIEERTPSQPA